MIPVAYSHFSVLGPVKRNLCLCLALLMTVCATAQGQHRPVGSSKHLADYDNELRGADRRVDTDALVQKLNDLGVTTYYWLIWHARTDWDDLKLFLPKAAKAHIAVWVYLVPPTEGPPNGYAASEPFGMDYPRWGEEIARLSLQHTNLTGWVIDDFYGNHQLFTPAYIRDMQGRAKRINPGLVFLPLMYFGEINRQFVENYREVIDGVVVAYPNDREEINDARAILNGPGSFHIPFMLMTAATTSEFRLRHGDPASAERMAEWLGMCLQAWRDGQCDGVVTYCLEKQPQSEVFPLARKLFREYGRNGQTSR